MKVPIVDHTYRVRSWTFFSSGGFGVALVARAVVDSCPVLELSLLLLLAFKSVETSDIGYSELVLSLLASPILLFAKLYKAKDPDKEGDQWTTLY